MNHPIQNNTSSPIRMVDNHLQNSSTTMSWEALCDEFHPSIDLLRQLEQSMQFHDLDDDDDDEDNWSQPNDDNHASDRQYSNQKNSMYHKTKTVTQIPEIVSPEQSLWRIRFLRLIGFNAFLVAAAMVFNVALYTTPDNNKLLSLILIILNILQVLIMVLFYLVFRIYNYHVQQTNVDILQKSTKALQFVGQMFPENLREQLFNHNNKNNDIAQHNESMIGNSNHKSQAAVSANTIDIKNNNNNEMPMDIESAMVHRSSTDTTTTYATTDVTNNNSGLVGHNDEYTPIAELYPETTVMLADLAGFTAWSAVHEPSEVFMLLETIFYEFDVLASKRNIFKVETVGDCYVAVAGVPEPRPDHGVVMARFARECMMRFQSIVQQLEVRFGPGTSELGMRIGLNSGPITGGVLRGERSRFQLFGDTINTAARMESNSSKGRIQVSETTAQLLFNANKHHWLIKRDDEIEAKGKGTLQTYWLDINANNGSMIGSAVGGGNNISKPVVSEESSV